MACHVNAVGSRTDASGDCHDSEVVGNESHSLAQRRDARTSC